MSIFFINKPRTDPSRGKKQKQADGSHRKYGDSGSDHRSLFDSFFLSGTKVLCNISRHRRSHGIGEQPDQHVQLVTDTPGCDAVGSHRINTRLYDGIGDWKQHGLQGKRKSGTDHHRHMLSAKMQMPDMHFSAKMFFSRKEQKGQNHADDLCRNRGSSRTAYSQVQNTYQKKIT